MKKRKRLQRTGSILLALCLCISFMPWAVFAEGDVTEQQTDGQDIILDQNVSEEDVTQEDILAEDELTDEGASDEFGTEELKSDAAMAVAETEADQNEQETELETLYVPKEGTDFKLDGNSLHFNSAVVSNPPEEMGNLKIDHTWIKSTKKSIKVNWKNPSAIKNADGVIILRKTGNSDTAAYKEIARLKFRNGDAWNIKTVYNDTKANVKDKRYSYIAVTYLAKDDGDGMKTYISHCSDWSCGVITGSKKINAYKAKVNKTSDTLEYRKTDKLQVTFSNKKTLAKETLRWYSSNKSVVTVNNMGRITAKGVGNATVTCRIPAGYDITCKVKVVGALKPGTPKIKVDTANRSSITLIWNKTGNATSYDVYFSNGSFIGSTTKTTYKVTGLTEGAKYSMYVKAVRTNDIYEEDSDASNVVTQKAVILRRDTILTGWPTSRSFTSSGTLREVVKITSPDGRKMTLEMKNGNRWVTKKKINLPSGSGTKSVTVTFPNDWKKTEKTYWRLVIPQNATSKKLTTKTFTITLRRAYQNPSSYFQISNSISKHGHSYFVSKVLVNNNSSKSSCIEAMITTANKYKGTNYYNGKSGAPGTMIDASGLVIQSCYGGGIDMWPISPATRPTNCVPKIMSSKLRTIKWATSSSNPTDHPGVMRGDLIFFYTSGKTVGHVAIYLGWDKVIHADPVRGYVTNSTIAEMTDPNGSYRFSVAGVRRVYN